MVECIYCEQEFIRPDFINKDKHRCYDNVIASIKTRKEKDPGYIFKKKTLPIDETMTIDGGNWSKVRSVPKGSRMFKSKDQLAGTEVYGEKFNDDQEWSIKFDDVEFNQFLFVTGDKKLWMIVHKRTLFGKDGTDYYY